MVVVVNGITVVVALVTVIVEIEVAKSVVVMTLAAGVVMDKPLRTFDVDSVVVFFDVVGLT